MYTNLLCMWEHVWHCLLSHNAPMIGNEWHVCVYKCTVSQCTINCTNSTDSGIVTVLCTNKNDACYALDTNHSDPLSRDQRVYWAVKLLRVAFPYARSFLIPSLIKWFVSAIWSAHSQTTSLNTEGHSSSNAVSLLLAATAPLVRPCAMLSDTFCVADGCICRAGCT